MINRRALKTLLAVVILSLVTGCKIAVITVEGGEVVTSGWFEDACPEGTICIREVNSASDTRSFHAVPKAGWRFVKWNKGEGFLCGDFTSDYCDLQATEGNEFADAFIASSRTYYLMPVFAPLTEIGATVTMNGKAWAPMNSFGDLSWDEINAACPVTNGGHCLVGSQLMEYDMTGWTWASVDDVNALFSSFPLYPGGPVTGQFNTAVGFALRREGFPETTYTYDVCSGCNTSTWKGWTSTKSSIAGQAYLADAFIRFIKFDIMADATTSLADATSAGHSAWFYRTP